MSNYALFGQGKEKVERQKILENRKDFVFSHFGKIENSFIWLRIKNKGYKM